jgi:HlyD family secretion protein
MKAATFLISCLNHMKRLLIAPLLTGIILSSGCKPPGGSVPKYETAPAFRGDIVDHVTASGSLSAVISVDVGSQVSGKIVALYADFNSPVNKGQLVAEIDTTVYAAVLRQAEGDLASARAEVTLKRQNLERKKILVPKKAASQLDLDQATAELAQAEASIIIKEAVVESAKANLGYCKITAPVDGIVIARKVDLGQTVIAAMSTPILFTIAKDITKMNISASVSEADIGQVKNGQPVDFAVDAFPDDVFHGTVTQVRRAPTTTQNVVTYETLISVDNPEQKLFPGMTADVSVLVSERKGVLKVPNTALRFTPPEGAKFEQFADARPTDGARGPVPPPGGKDAPPGAFAGKASPWPPPAASKAQQGQPAKLARNQRLVYSPGSDPATLKPILIKTGITDGIETEVLDGLSEGALVVTSAISVSPTSGGLGGPPPPAP